MERYTKFIFNFKFFIIFTIVLMVFFLAAGGQFLKMSTDYRMFFSKQNPNLQAFETLQRTYSKHDNVLFALTPKNNEVFTEKNLTAIQWLTEQSWLIPYANRVDSLTNFQDIRAEGDDLYVNDLIPDDFEFSDSNLKLQKQTALDEPMLFKRLISEDAKVAGVNVTVQFPDEDLEKAVPEVVAKVRELKEEFQQKFPDIQVNLTGVVMQNNAFIESSMHDLMTLVPLMLLLVIIGVGVFMRNIWALISVVIVIVGSILAAMGIAGYLGITLSPASVTAPTVIMTLAVADCVHLLSTYYWRIDHGDTKSEALRYSFKVNTMPIFLTTFTTMLGFLSLNFSDAPPFRDLGNIVAIGVIAAFVITMTLTPALLVLFPAKRAKSKDTLYTVFPKLAEGVIHYKKPLIAVLGTLCVVCLLFLPKNELNDEWIGYFDRSIPFRYDADYVINNLTGLSSIHYSVESQAAEGIHEPEYMEKLDQFVNWLQTQPEVVQVSDVSHIIKKLNQAMHNDNSDWYKLPANRELIAQYLLLYEMSLPRGLDVNNQINVDKSATRVQVVLKKLSTNQILNFEERVQDWMEAHFPDHMQSLGTSPDIMFAHIGFSNIRSMLFGLCVALAGISLVLCIAFRSIKFGLFSAIPNLLPIGVSFGIWGLWVGEIGLSLSVVAGMTLGIVVDDTIHFLSKYRHARLEDKSPEDATRYAFTSVGKALFVTSVVLVIGFSTLILSDFKLNSSMGLLTAVTIGLAFVIDFFLIPPLLLAFEERHDAIFSSSTSIDLKPCL